MLICSFCLLLFTFMLTCLFYFLLFTFIYILYILFCSILLPVHDLVFKKLFCLYSYNFCVFSLFQYFENDTRECRNVNKKTEMLWLFYALKFISLLRFPKSVPATTTLYRRYGQPVLTLLRKWEKTWRKFEKAKQDLVFLNRCELYDVIPKFLHF